MPQNNSIKYISKLLKTIKWLFSDSNIIRYLFFKKIGLKFRPKTFEFPKMICVETSSYCNLSCKHCPRNDLVKNDKLTNSFMDINLYKKIIDEMSQYKHTILRPMGRGEALTNPEFIRMIQYAKKKGIQKVWLNTNGTLLSPKVSRGLLDAGIDRIEVSIDAASQEMFYKIKGKDLYDKVVKNTIECCRLKNELYPEIEIVASFVETEINTSEKNNFINFWNNYTDSVNIRPVHQAGALVKNLRFNKRKSEEERLPCSMLWYRAEIDYSGGLKYCELDWENSDIIGSLKESTIKEIWNSKNYKRLRILHTEKRFSEIPLCKICKSYHELSEWGE